MRRLFALLLVCALHASAQSTPYYDALLRRLAVSPAGTGASGTQMYSCSVSGVSSIACTHNLGTTTPQVWCYDGSGNFLGGSSASTSVSNVVATSSNVAAITFSASTTGTCMIGTGGQGPTGATGPAPTITAESAGSNCTYGGTKVVSGSTTRYVCNGAPGSGSGDVVRIASGTAALGTSAISSGACATAVTVSATGVLATDAVTASFNADPTAVTGYVPGTSGMLTIIPYPTADNVNFKVCNNTASSITPGAITLNWRVVR